MTTPAPGHVHGATAKPLLGDTIDGLPERVLLQLAVPNGATPTHHRIFNNGWFINVADAKFGEQVCAWMRLSEGSGASTAQVQETTVANAWPVTRRRTMRASSTRSR